MINPKLNISNYPEWVSSACPCSRSRRHHRQWSSWGRRWRPRRSRAVWGWSGSSCRRTRGCSCRWPRWSPGHTGRSCYTTRTRCWHPSTVCPAAGWPGWCPGSRACRCSCTSPSCWCTAPCWSSRCIQHWNTRQSRRWWLLIPSHPIQEEGLFPSVLVQSAIWSFPLPLVQQHSHLQPGPRVLFSYLLYCLC